MLDTYRHTKTIFTLGPASLAPEKLGELIRRGADVCRINMAHASPDWVRESVALVRKTSDDIGRHVAFMMDVKGPEVRTGRRDEAIEIAAGDKVVFYDRKTPAPTADGVLTIEVNYPWLHEDLKVDGMVIVDSGLLRFVVEKIEDGGVWCRTEVGGKLGSRRHINLPGVHVRLPSLTNKDRANLELAVEVGFDFIALSFVRDAAAVTGLRCEMDSIGLSAKIISKIENHEGMENIVEIVEASDAIMIARGDLGTELPPEHLPKAQRAIGRACLTGGKPFIVATQLLESMIENPVPTRAEVTDISVAIEELADAVMLSGETSVGKFPISCLDMLHRVAKATELHEGGILNEELVLTDPGSKLLKATAVLAEEVNGGIIVFTHTGVLPRLLSGLRPAGVPIYAFTDNPAVFRELMLHWGIEPFLTEFAEDAEETITSAFTQLLKRGWAEPGDQMAVIVNVLGDKTVNTIQLREV